MIVFRCVHFLRLMPLLALLLQGLSYASGADQLNNVAPPVYSYQVVRTLPHDPQAFTQGLVLAGGYFYESTGLYGFSTLRKVEPDSGRVVRSHSLPERYHGEGIVLHEGKIYQLTWRAGTVFVYDAATFDQLENFSCGSEGWGITSDGKKLIMSDGSSLLYFRDPRNFELIGKVRVTDGSKPVTQINELEYVKGRIYANIWKTDRVAVIVPETGKVAGWIDFTGLFDSNLRADRQDVLNGIAYDAVNDRLFVTGKRWPTIFEVAIIPEHQK